MSMRAPIEAINPGDVARPGGHYSHAIRVGELIVTSGQLGIRPDGSHTASMGFEVQARQAIGNLLGVLRAAGASPQDILKVTVYIAGVHHWPRFNEIYAQIMGEARPARSVVPVPELHYGYLVEIEAIAMRREPIATSEA